MKRTTLRLPTGLQERLDRFVEENDYPNRAEALRDIVRDRLNEEEAGSDA